MAVLECCEPADAGGGIHVLALNPITVLPDGNAPEMVICLCADQRWLIADRHGVRPLGPESVVRLHGCRWRLREPAPAAAATALRFRVSQDEEHVRLEFAGEGGLLDFGERVHHQSLLLLARERRADERHGVVPAECGWRDVAALQRMLGIGAEHFNIHVFRARRQVEPALRERGVAATLVERRSGQVRFGSLGFEVAAGGRV